MGVLTAVSNLGCNFFRILTSGLEQCERLSFVKIADYKVVSFDTTPITSTYLIALVVGEYEYVEGVSEEGIKVRVYTPLGKKEQVRRTSRLSV